MSGRPMRGPQRGKVRLERRLRRQATGAETKLWFSLRDRRLGGFKFVRQDAIGPYVVDFVCRAVRTTASFRHRWLGGEGAAPIEPSLVAVRA